MDKYRMDLETKKERVKKAFQDSMLKQSNVYHHAMAGSRTLDKHRKEYAEAHEYLIQCVEEAEEARRLMIKNQQKKEKEKRDFSFELE